VKAAAAQGAQAVIHCGDVIGSNTLRALQGIGLPVHVVQGNNIGDVMAMMRLARSPAAWCATTATMPSWRSPAARSSPSIISYRRRHGRHRQMGPRLLGHSHQALIARIRNVRGGETLLVNPGTVAGLSAPPTYALGDLATLEFPSSRCRSAERARHPLFGHGVKHARCGAHSGRNAEALEFRDRIARYHLDRHRRQFEHFVGDRILDPCA